MTSVMIGMILIGNLIFFSSLCNNKGRWAREVKLEKDVEVIRLSFNGPSVCK